jgi:hypothetical protein
MCERMAENEEQEYCGPGGRAEWQFAADGFPDQVDGVGEERGPRWVFSPRAAMSSLSRHA